MDKEDLKKLIDKKLKVVLNGVDNAYSQLKVEDDLNEWFKSLSLNEKLEIFDDFSLEESTEIQYRCFKCGHEIHSCICR